jgi:hypothetical protein
MALLLKPIAKSPLGDDVFRIAGIDFDLAAQRPNIVLHVLHLARVFRLPDFTQPRTRFGLSFNRERILDDGRGRWLRAGLIAFGLNVKRVRAGREIIDRDG